jgi:hypothetical protein
MNSKKSKTFSNNKLRLNAWLAKNHFGGLKNVR